MKEGIKQVLAINEGGRTRPLYLHLRSRFFAGNLVKLAAIHGDDKKFGHNYIPLYECFFYPIRKRTKAFLEPLPSMLDDGGRHVIEDRQNLLLAGSYPIK